MPAETIWVLKDSPSGEVLGVGFNAANALYNTVPNVDTERVRTLLSTLDLTLEDDADTAIIWHNGYELRRITLPSPHDAAIVRAAEAHIDAGLAYEKLLPSLETLDWSEVESGVKTAFDACMDARNTLRDAVRAKREAK